MVIPQKIKIGGITYDIKLIDGTDLPNDELSDLVWENLSIRISKELPFELQLACLWHEVLHAINNQLQEEEVESLAQSITQIILDNKL